MKQTALSATIFSILIVVTRSLHLQGSWNTDGFFLFLAKFGFQKSNLRDLEQTQGFIYGNITTDGILDETLTLVVADSEHFVDIYTNRSSHSNETCGKMFRKIDSIAFDASCNPSGKQDFLRKIPCPLNKLCIDEDDPKNVIPEFQFTYKVRDTERPRFWYMSIVACHRDPPNFNSQCQWQFNKLRQGTIRYDIWMVNGHPNAKHLNPFEHQFSFEMHDVFEIHLGVLLLTCLLFSLWVYTFLKQRHMLTKIFTASFVLKLVGISCSLLDTTIFAFNGEGAEWLNIAGSLIRLTSECLFMLFLLLIAKGWGITTEKLERKAVLFTLWSFYTVLNVVLFVWNLTEVDYISNLDEWQTYPGYLTQAFRIVIMVWFLVELRKTFLSTAHSDRLSFFQHFGAFCMVWFVYLPVLALISTQVSVLWRYKTILCISYAADILAYMVLIHLFWPSKSVLYMIKGEVPLQTYELEITGLLDDIQETAMCVGSLQVNQAEEEMEEELHQPSLHHKSDDHKSNGVILNNNDKYQIEPSNTSL